LEPERNYVGVLEVKKFWALPTSKSCRSFTVSAMCFASSDR
jgi:hypothetical protein